MKRFADYMAVSLAGSCLLWSCGKTSDTTKPVEPDLRTSVYRTLTTVDLVKDTRVRESVPAQTQGTFSTIKFGRETNGALNLLFLDSSVVFQDSIPAGSEITACTLWIKINQMPILTGDSVVVDLWSVSESWNENETSWSNRTTAQSWSASGGAGSLVSPGLLMARRIDNFRFEWRLKGDMYDTITVETAPHIPIPIDSSLAQANLDGSSFGFSFRSSPQSSAGALFGVVTSEAAANQNRPYFSWVYRSR